LGIIAQGALARKAVAAGGAEEELHHCRRRCLPTATPHAATRMLAQGLHGSGEAATVDRIQGRVHVQCH
jgi:hypothetical protein